MGLEWDASSLFKGLAGLEAKTNSRLTQYGETWAARLEARARKNAKWQDRTGEARASIKGFSYWRGKLLVVGVSGDTDYFPYLEFANKKKARLSKKNKRKGATTPPKIKTKYGVLFPTIRQNAYGMFKSLDRIIEK